MLRWRGDIAGVGIAASGGVVNWQAVRDMTASGVTYATLRPGQVYQAGLQATAYGVTIGGNYEWGQENFFHGNVIRGDQSAQQITVGGSYTVGAFSIGANSFWGSYAGAGGSTFCSAAGVAGACTANNVGALVKNTDGSANSMRRYSYSAGANYRLAPGLDLVAEYARHVVHEPGYLSTAPTSNKQDTLKTDVIIVGTRLAF